MPPGIQILMLLVAVPLFRRRPRIAWTLSAVALGSLYFFSTHVGLEMVAGPLENQYPTVTLSSASTADAIVVLGDFQATPTARRPMIGLRDETDRLYNGIQLYKAGKAPLLVLSGGSVMLFGPTLASQALYAKKLAEEWGVPAAAVIAEAESQNTHENAVRTAGILLPRHARRILLVTSGYHMPRSAAIFRKEGFDVLPFPADFHTGWDDPSFPLSYIPDARNLYLNRIALHELMGLVVYKMRGWA